MVTYELKKSPGIPLYESLYRCIREDILSGKLAPGQKLPSKRALAEHLEISRVTVEGAYDQLLAEGFIRSRERVGYFAEAVQRGPTPEICREQPGETAGWKIDLTANASTDFPFSVWSSLQRQVMLDLREALLRPMPNQGIWELRRAIAAHLAAFRGMRVEPEQILIGAGTDFLYNLLIQLLGRDRIYAVEEPGYSKIRQIYGAGGVRCVSAELDEQGVRPGALKGAQVLHISPSHHFPSGLVTPMRRRRELLAWVEEARDRWIIEDDYDSEFRFTAHPMPTMAAMDGTGRVIYMNTFSKTLAPSIRISYMVLSPELMERFQRELGFYSCTVPSFEQHTLARFLDGGHFEKHINRMRKAYKQRRNAVAAALLESPFGDRMKLLEQDAGLHFLLRLDTELEDEALEQRCADAGIRVLALSRYYHGPVPEEDRHCLVINYSGITPEQIGFLKEIISDI